jgi:hypothetical protein
MITMPYRAGSARGVRTANEFWFSSLPTPFLGTPASLGPGLRTVSGANRRRDGSSPSRASLQHVDRRTK